MSEFAFERTMQQRDPKDQSRNEDAARLSPLFRSMENGVESVLDNKLFMRCSFAWIVLLWVIFATKLMLTDPDNDKTYSSVYRTLIQNSETLNTHKHSSRVMLATKTTTTAQNEGKEHEKSKEEIENEITSNLNELEAQVITALTSCMTLQYEL